MVKTLKNLLQNQNSFEAESWYIALESQDLPNWFKPIFTRFHMEPSVEEVLLVCPNGSAPLNKIAAMPIYDQTLKLLLLQSQDSFEAESWVCNIGDNVY